MSASSTGHIERLDAWRRRRGERRADRPKLRKLRLILLLGGLGALALVSTVFGMMMAVASDLPQLENKEVFRVGDKRNSVLLDRRGKDLGLLTGNQNVVLVGYRDIAPVMRQADIPIGDRHLLQNKGFDVKGIGRALVQDVITRDAAQGGSTITQQFVKNQLAAQGNRTLFQKLREAALAYHLTQKWRKDKILTEYLNSIYFGNGAYGVESAARVYFGKAHPGCGEDNTNPCSRLLTPVEAASLAAMVSSPTGYDPVAHPEAFTKRRNVVLQKLVDEDHMSRGEFDRLKREAPPTESELSPPAEKTKAPYFTSWVRQSVVRKLGPRAFYGNYRIKTSLDLDLQQAADEAVTRRLSSPDLPTASLVAIDNKSGEVRAMVGGRDYNEEPFNLATEGQRQPGSAFKPFTLAVALEHGYTPGSILASRRKVLDVRGANGNERFVVNNYEGDYSGSNTLAGAMAVSDNSIYAELGVKVGTRRVARMARRMGIRTPVSHNLAMTLGGLKQGVTPLDMAHAYSTFATGGRRTLGGDGLGSEGGGPSGIHSIEDKHGHVIATNRPHYARVMPEPVANTVSDVLTGVVRSGTGKEANISGFAAGKTGTTENYGDAWFVGWNEQLTVAVWVVSPQGVKPMKTEFGGEPVAGGTYPAEIWRDFMTQAMAIDLERHPEKAPPTTTGPSYTGV